MLKRLISKITAMCAMMALIGCLFMSNVYADGPVVTYGVEFTDTTATVTFHITEIEAFDIGAIYDPDKVTIKEMSYTEEVTNTELEGNTILKVQNEAAMDETGNTYAVFVGAGYTPSNEPIPYEGQPLCKIVFEGDLANSEITLVTGTATVSDVHTAANLGTVSLNQPAGTSITPAPVDAVSEAEDGEDKSGQSEESKDDNGSADNKDANDGKDNNNTIVYVLVGAAIVLVIVVVIIIVSKNKKK